MLALKKLYNSSKFWFAMIIYIPATVALFMTKLDGQSYYGIVGIVSSVFLTAHVVSDVVSQKINASTVK